METKSIRRLLSLLELGGQTALVRIYPLAEPPSPGSSPGSPGWSQGNSYSTHAAAPWYADLYMQAGQMEYCAVFKASGERRFIGDQALNFLGQMGGLFYELLPLPTAPGFPPPEGEASPFATRPGGYAGTTAPPERFIAPQSREEGWFPAAPNSPPISWRPVRTRWGDLMAQNAQRLTRDQRRILSLINGRRSVGELSRLLGTSPTALSEILTFFRDQNLIS